MDENVLKLKFNLFFVTATAGYYVPHQQHPQQLQQSHQLSPKYHMQAQHLSQKTYYNHPDNIHQQQQTQQLYNPGNLLFFV